MSQKRQFSFDLKDKQLLYLLDVNGRSQYSELAKKTRMSKQRVLYRVQRLEREGVIKGYYAVIDTSRLGYTSFRVYLKLRTISRAERIALLNSLAEIPQVWAVYTFVGRYDVALGIAVKGVGLFHSVWDDLLAKHLSAIKDYAIAIYEPVYHYPKAYLLPSAAHEPARVIGGNPVTDFDSIDWQILSALANNARTTLVEIAASTGLTAEGVSARIKALEKKKIILGYRAMIDVHKLGYEYYKADIRLRSYTKIKEIQAYCAEHPNIYQFDKTIGGETLEIEFNVTSLPEMLAILDDLETTIPGQMESFEYLTIVDELKTTYLPIKEK